MIPSFLDHMLLNAPGAVGAYYSAYKTWRWGDPYVRLISSLANRNRLAIDVGAHLGEFTFFMRRYSGRCIAFECNPALVSHLRRRFGTSVDIRPQAVSDRMGTAELRIPQHEWGLGRATIEPSNTLDEFNEFKLVSVEKVTLDAVIDAPVGLIKIDVEGHEMAVLSGAMRILQTDKPNLLVEIQEKHNPGCTRAVFGLLGGLGYRAFRLQVGSLMPVSQDEPTGEGLWNYVFRAA